MVPTDPLREGSRGGSISERSDSWVWGLELCLQHYPRRAQINQGLGGPGPSSVFRCLCEEGKKTSKDNTANIQLRSNEVMC